jgi:hypothetical protein
VVSFGAGIYIELWYFVLYDGWFIWLIVNGLDFAWFRINYALYEELDAEDIERTREVYRYACFC